MKQQLLLDLKKISSDKIYLGLFLFILFVFLSPLMYFQHMDMEASKLIEIREAVTSTQEGIEQMKEANVPLAVKDEEERLALLETYLFALVSKQPNEIVKTQLAYEKKNLAQMENGTQSGIPIIEQRKLVAELSYLTSHDLVPIDKFSPSAPAINFISNEFRGFISFTMILIFPALIFSRIYSSEKDQSTKDFLNMAPISYTKISFSKLVSSTLFSFGYFFLSIGLAGLILSLKNGIGYLNYPIPISKDGITVYILTTSQFLAQVFILLFFIYVFLSCLSFLISQFTSSFLIQTVILLMVIMIPSSPLFTAESVIADIAHLLPFSYFDLSKVLTYGDSYLPVINQQVTLANGLICLAGYSVLCLAVSAMIIKKKESL